MDYLKSNDVLVYLSDALTQLLKNRANYPTREAAMGYLAEYFRTLKFGRHVLFRGIDFVMATRHNRQSFVQCAEYVMGPADGRKASEASFGITGGSTAELLSIADYHNCIALICKDFPISLVLKAASMLVVEDGLECRLPFAEFVRAFKIQMVYNEFLDECRVVFKGLASRSRDGTVPSAAFLARIKTLSTRGSVIPHPLIERAVKGLDHPTDVMDVLHALARSPAVFDAAGQ
mmetsp:Transcript_22863/g.68840  ORF Transcript_22863/g.68840 Transcript_22863/m.68840 type:complete len:233 (+) Transcript_22863:13-711(+)